MDHHRSAHAGDGSPLALDATALAQAVRERRWRCTEVTAAALQRVADVDGGLHAFCTLDGDAALAQCRSAGCPTCCRAFDRPARWRAGGDQGPDLHPGPAQHLRLASVRRVRAAGRRRRRRAPARAGAVLLGKTNTSEFGYGAVGHNPLFATTRNPWNPVLTPGGSSAGSAAAVAARMVPLRVGQRRRRLCAHPGLVVGRVWHQALVGRVPVYPGCRDPRYPGISSWESLEHIGPDHSPCR